MIEIKTKTSSGASLPANVAGYTTSSSATSLTSVQRGDLFHNDKIFVIYNNNGDLKYVRKMYDGTSKKYIYDTVWYDFYPIIEAVPFKSGQNIVFSVYSRREGSPYTPTVYSYDGGSFSQVTVSQMGSSAIFFITVKCKTGSISGTNAATITISNGLNSTVEIGSPSSRNIQLYATSSYSYINQLLFTNFNSYRYSFSYLKSGETGDSISGATAIIMKPDYPGYQDVNFVEIANNSDGYTSTTSQVMFSRYYNSHNFLQIFEVLTSSTIQNLGVYYWHNFATNSSVKGLTYAGTVTGVPGYGNTGYRYTINLNNMSKTKTSSS